jgi:diadenosine tetraphosphatase ApaH/serine/threonine PP2A family protein phosphatase
MKAALLSDIHGNLEAFQAVRESIAAHGAEDIIFLGDIVGYGAEPNECIDLLRTLTGCSIAGNHDFAAVHKTDIKYFNPHAKEAIVWTAQQLTAENTRFLSSLPLLATRHHVTFVHSTPMFPQLWDYIMTTAEAGVSFKNFSGQACFIGHSHYPLIFAEDSSGAITESSCTECALETDCRYIINIGSVGQPRDGTPLASYGLYDTEAKEFRLIRVAYDIVAAQRKILAAGLPPFLASRLALGR